MNRTTESRYTHLGETCGCTDRDHDLVHELSLKLDTVWRLDQYIANADGRSGVQDFWRDLKRQELSNIDQIKKFVGDEVRLGSF